MSNKHRSTIAPQILDEASEWLVTMREPDTSSEDREAFGDWLRASPVHVGAYLEIARLWSDASCIDREFAIDLSAGMSANVVSLGTSARSPLQEPVTRKARSVRLFALAASLLIAFVAVGSWLYIERGSTYATDIGEQRTITLEDGSIVKLNSRSELRARMAPERRQIELIRGQALFQVAHDANRPFIVTSGNSSIRAVGTQFDVNRKHSGTVVTVIEGRVRLDAIPPSPLIRWFSPAPTSASRPSSAEPAEVNSVPTSGSASPDSARTVLSAGEQIRIATTGAIEKTVKPNTAAAISWLEQELIFEGQPLTDVVEEFNRYTRTPIVLADPSLADLRINAVFHTTNPDSLLRFLSRYQNVQIEHTGKEIRISKTQ